MNARVRLLLLNQFTIKLGFNLLMPYLAGHLTHGLGYAAWAVGLVLSVRNASQRGLCLVGGRLADRLGYKQAIVAGCALRTGGFALLGAAASLPALMAASALVGFAGALFDPGVRAYLAVEAGERRSEAFAAFNVAGQAGLLLGPLAGLALSGLNFQAVAAAAAGLFALLTFVQATALPARPPSYREAGQAWLPVLANRRLLAFSVVMSVSYVLSFQVYLALPLVMRQAVGVEQDVGMGQLFALSAVVVIAGQPLVTSWVRRRWTPARTLVAGLVVSGTAFVPLVLCARPAALAIGPEEVGEVLGIAPILATAVLLSLGTMLICPFEMDVIVALARDRMVATHYGLYATVSGLVVTVGGLLTGVLWDYAASQGADRLPWIVMTAVGCCAAYGLAVLHRVGALTAAHTGKHRAIQR